MKPLIVKWFPYVLAAALPLAGLFLAGAWALDGRRQEGAWMAGAALLGALIWVTALTA